MTIEEAIAKYEISLHKYEDESTFGYTNFVVKQLNINSTKEFLETLKELKTDIVRCSECKYSKILEKDRAYCRFHGFGLYQKDYCSYGERK